MIIGYNWLVFITLDTAKYFKMFPDVILHSRMTFLVALNITEFAFLRSPLGVATVYVVKMSCPANINHIRYEYAY